MSEAIRIAKRLAEQLGCSRREAEHYIAGGWVSVDGKEVDDPATRVTPEQQVTLAADANLEPLVPMTLLMYQEINRPREAHRASQWLSETDRIKPHGEEEPLLRRHTRNLTALMPLEEDNACGLVVFTQDGRVIRKLTEDADLIEQEWLVEYTGTLDDAALARLNRPWNLEDTTAPRCKVSRQSDNKLRFAVKGPLPGQIGGMLGASGVEVVWARRIRLGRIGMAGLAVGQWRFTRADERF